MVRATGSGLGCAVALGALSGGLAYAQDAEDFEDVVVLGEEQPDMIGSTNPIGVPNGSLPFGGLPGFDIPDTPSAPFVPGPGPAPSFDEVLALREKGDPKSALMLGKAVGAQGDLDAQLLVGVMLMRGEAGLVDDYDAVSWLTKAAIGGTVDAMLALGEMAVGHRGGLTSTDAVGWYKKAADLGDTQAMRALSTLAAEGIGVVEDVKVASAWEERAASSGDAVAMRRRGEAMIDSDPQAALGWLEKAAAVGDAPSAYAAAILLKTNYDVRPDEAKAARLMKQAADAGVPAALADYGLMVYQGAGADRDEALAADYFRRAAEAGDTEGQFLWAFTLAKGEGVSQDYGEAYYWLLKSGGDTGVGEYDASRAQLREKLEGNVELGVLEAARRRYKSER